MSPPPPRIVAAALGNTLEVFDFIAHGTYAVMISAYADRRGNRA